MCGTFDRISVFSTKYWQVLEKLKDTKVDRHNMSKLKRTNYDLQYVCFVDRCLSFCTFSFWPLCCLFFFDIRIMIAPLVSSNSFYNTLHRKLKIEQHRRRLNQCALRRLRKGKHMSCYVCYKYIYVKGHIIFIHFVISRFPAQNCLLWGTAYQVLGNGRVLVPLVTPVMLL